MRLWWNRFGLISAGEVRCKQAGQPHAQLNKASDMEYISEVSMQQSSEIESDRTAGSLNSCRISIALATCNGERFISEQLQSLNEQVLAPHELVVCDDVSTDKTFIILEQFVENARFPVRLYRNDVRLGFRANFMKAASLCEGDL
ncbi:glycosyltransferase [Novosphingobium sp. 9U]|uniref:glycosyltransferase n=1 Tax=Novosphingobium sp. 9U TaxID=2653158 RepID=UPI001F43418D|nr:glycosyltransferase [Novosphingobium sp. 9U]